MRLHVVSDVHGRADALARAADGADALICLGDLVLFLDYEDSSQGIFADAVRRREHRALRRAAHRGPLRRRAAPGPPAWWDEVERRGSRPAHAASSSWCGAQYAELFAAMPTPAYLTYGNVDIPAFWPDYLRPGHTVLDGEVVEIGGLRFGFVGGGLVSPMRTPYELERGDVRRQGRRARRGRRALRAHPSRAARALLRRRRPAVRGRQPRDPRARARAPSRARCCSGTSTSRSCAAPGSAAPSA